MKWSRNGRTDQPVETVSMINGKCLIGVSFGIVLLVCIFRVLNASFRRSVGVQTHCDAAHGSPPNSMGWLVIHAMGFASPRCLSNKSTTLSMSAHCIIGIIWTYVMNMYCGNGVMVVFSCGIPKKSIILSRNGLVVVELTSHHAVSFCRTGHVSLYSLEHCTGWVVVSITARMAAHAVVRNM